jgi:hypothetical protein
MRLTDTAFYLVDRPASGARHANKPRQANGDGSHGSGRSWAICPLWPMMMPSGVVRHLPRPYMGRPPHGVRWPSGEAPDCKSVNGGSIPPRTSKPVIAKSLRAWPSPLNLSRNPVMRDRTPV